MGSLEGRGPQTDKYLPQSPFTGKFSQMTTFSFGVFTVNWRRGNVEKLFKVEHALLSCRPGPRRSGSVAQWPCPSKPRQLFSLFEPRSTI
jgi:hypothetical protein